MKILVTGATGSVGKEIVNRLDREGHSTVVIGRREEADTGPAEYRRCDISDFTTLLEVTRGMDAIIHLAAVPHPFSPSAEAIFQTNVAGTFNVYEAAARNGVPRVVSASSINAFGFNFGIKPFRIASFPIDEETPGETTDVYSLSKQMGEEIAEYYYRKDGIGGASIRIPWVYHPKDEVLERFRNEPARFRAAMEELETMPVQERQAKVAELVAAFDRYRADRYTPGYRDLPPEEKYREESVLMYGRNDFYTVIDHRDSAQGFVKAATAPYEGVHTLFINDSHNHTGIVTRKLAETMYPVPDTWTGEWKTPVSGTESLVSIEKARRLIGYEPEYSLKRFYDGGEN